MATAVERKPCAKCHKGGGVTTCEGCQQSFCIKHIIEHRQELAVKMDAIGQEHDSLRHDLDEEDASHPLLLQIDKWEEETIVKIRTAAKTARAELRQMLDQVKNDIKMSADKITNELQGQRESDDYTEIDLNRWSTQLTNMRKLLQTPSTIQISEHDNPSNIIHLIKVADKAQSSISSDRTIASKRHPSQSHLSYASTEEVFDRATKGISLLENGLLAIYTDKSNYKYNTIFGKTVYQYGAHEVDFRVEKKDFDNLFFGIITSSQDLVERIFDTSSANGWWGFDVPVVGGKKQKYDGKKILGAGDLVKLTLDCDNQQIQFENYRAKITLQLRIDTSLCPLPWKIAISLSRPQDTLRILR